MLQSNLREDPVEEGLAWIDSLEALYLMVVALSFCEPPYVGHLEGLLVFFKDGFRQIDIRQSILPLQPFLHLVW